MDCRGFAEFDESQARRFPARQGFKARPGPSLSVRGRVGVTSLAAWAACDGRRRLDNGTLVSRAPGSLHKQIVRQMMINAFCRINDDLFRV